MYKLDTYCQVLSYAPFVDLFKCHTGFVFVFARKNQSCWCLFSLDLSWSNCFIKFTGIFGTVYNHIKHLRKYRILS